MSIYSRLGSGGLPMDRKCERAESKDLVVSKRMQIDSLIYRRQNNGSLVTLALVGVWELDNMVFYDN